MSLESMPLPGADLRLNRAFLPMDAADAAMTALREELPWTQRAIRVYGREVMQPRLLCWVGDPDANYRYSGGDYAPEAWTPALSDIRQRIESATASSFNSVLCNRYRNGDDAMGWHSDDEPELGAQPVIASLSLGVTRAMKFRPRKGFPEGRAGELPLAHGDLLVMAGDTQRHYQHAISRNRRITSERINLTFRLIHPSGQD